MEPAFPNDIDTPGLERSLPTARFPFKKLALPNTSKDQAAELYLQDRVSAAELASLAGDANALKTMMDWEQRELPASLDS